MTSRDAADDCYLAALRALGSRDRSAAELRDILTAKGCAPADAAAAVERLRADGRLDERRAAADYAEIAVRRKRFGPRRVALELEKRGYPRDVVGPLIDALRAGDHRAALAEEVARLVRAGASLETPALRARIYRRLVARGHEPEHVRQAIAALLRGAGPDEES